MEMRAWRAAARSIVTLPASAPATPPSTGCTRPVPPLHLDADRGEVLGRGEVAERLVRPDRVVGGLPRPQLGLERAEIGLGVGDLVELLGVGPVGALDRAVELGAARRQDEEGDAPRLAVRLELGHELAAAVDADRPDREGHPRREGIEDADRARRRGPPPELEDVPARHDVAGGELFERTPPRERADVERVELDEVARTDDRPAGRLAHGIGAVPAPLPGADPPAARFAQLTGPAQAGEDPPDQRARQRQAVTVEQDDELVLAPAGIGRAERLDGPQLRDRPGRPPPPTWRRAAILERLEMEPVVAREPAVHGRAAEAEVAGRPADVRAVPPVPIEHRQSLAGLAREARGLPPPSDDEERVRMQRHERMPASSPHATGRLRHREPSC